MIAEQKQRWQNQNMFLQDRHGSGKAWLEPEVIVVALPTCDADDRRGFDLLCWTINMAARSRDSIITLHPQHHDGTQESLAGYANESHAVNPQMKPLQDLCDVKQVHLEMRIVRNEVTEKMLAEEVSAMKATMLVVTTPGHHSLRVAQRRGNFLCRHVLAGCSIVVVKDYKVLFYKDNHFRANSTQRTCTPASEDGSTSANQASTCIETFCQTDAALTSCNKIWPESAGGSSPRRVLDSSDAFYDSDDSPGLSNDMGLTRSLSKRALVSYPSSSNDEDRKIFSKRKFTGCLSICRERGRVCRSLTFPSSRQFKWTLVYAHWKSLGNSFKSYMKSSWIAKPLKNGCIASTSIVLADRPCKIFTHEEISKATNLFSPGNLVGKGGHSEVYKGLLPEGQFVAVKRLIRGDTEEQKTVDFLTELGIICHTSHPNIIPLVGFCIEKGLHLVFQFVRHGSLALWLHSGKLPALKWATRYRIAVGTARGLNYLHTDCQRRVIHRDIKASNILLGTDFEPQELTGSPQAKT